MANINYNTDPLALLFKDLYKRQISNENEYNAFKTAFNEIDPDMYLGISSPGEINALRNSGVWNEAINNRLGGDLSGRMLDLANSQINSQPSITQKVPNNTTLSRKERRASKKLAKNTVEMPLNSTANAPFVEDIAEKAVTTNAAKEGAEKVAWGQNLKNKLNDFKANTTWTKGSGLQYKNHNIGKWSNIGQGVYQGVSALNNLGDLGDLREDTDTLENDIIRSAMSNPLASSYLTSDQEALLNKLRNGTYSEDADGGDFFDGVFSGLGNIATGVLMGAPGGVPGMIIGGLGSAINSGIQGMQQGQTETNAQLQGLYSALNQAEQQYRAMRRPNVTGLGLRQSALEQMY